MNSGENSVSIPIDLIPDILSRLPAKSIARFRCVSKLWGSLFCKSFFTELFLSRSSARPRLLIVVERDSELFLYSSPQPQNPYEKSSLVVATDFHMKISFDTTYYQCSYASGLLYFPSIQNWTKNKDPMKVICNPSTGQYVILPEPRTSYSCGGDFLVFDPIGKQFKFFVMINRGNGGFDHHTLTLGTETPWWRTIQCPSIHYYRPRGNGICINGVLYFISYYGTDYLFLLGYFDVRSEKLKFIDLDPYCDYGRSTKLINYKGKLGVVNNLDVHYHGGFPIKLQMWVLEDAEKPEWSTYVYTLRTGENKVVRDDDDITVVGATALGEIVLAKDNACKPFCVFYFNPERNTLLTVEIQGVREEGKIAQHLRSDNHQVYVFVDHVEDLHYKFDVMNTIYAATSISQPEKSTSSKEDHQVRTVAHQRQDRRRDHHQREDYVAHQGQDRRKDHQVRTVAHQQQDRRTFECVNKFDALRFLEDD